MTFSVVDATTSVDAAGEEKRLASARNRRIIGALFLSGPASSDP